MVVVFEGRCELVLVEDGSPAVAHAHDVRVAREGPDAGIHGHMVNGEAVGISRDACKGGRQPRRLRPRYGGGVPAVEGNQHQVVAKGAVEIGHGTSLREVVVIERRLGGRLPPPALHFMVADGNQHGHGIPKRGDHVVFVIFQHRVPQAVVGKGTVFVGAIAAEHHELGFKRRSACHQLTRVRTRAHVPTLSKRDGNVARRNRAELQLGRKRHRRVARHEVIGLPRRESRQLYPVYVAGHECAQARHCVRRPRCLESVGCDVAAVGHGVVIDFALPRRCARVIIHGHRRARVALPRQVRVNGRREIGGVIQRQPGAQRHVAAVGGVVPHANRQRVAASLKRSHECRQVDSRAPVEGGFTAHRAQRIPAQDYGIHTATAADLHPVQPGHIAVVVIHFERHGQNGRGIRHVERGPGVNRKDTAIAVD